MCTNVSRAGGTELGEDLNARNSRNLQEIPVMIG